MRRPVLLALLPAAWWLAACQRVTGLSDLKFDDNEPSAGGSAGAGGSEAGGLGGASGGSGKAGAGQGGAGGAGTSGQGGSAGAGQGGLGGASGKGGAGGSGGASGGGSGGSAGGTCKAGNQPPKAAFVASPVEGAAGDEAVLDASASMDPDGDPLVYAWEALSGAPAPADATKAQATVKTVDCAEYSYRVKVTDPCGASDEAEVKLSALHGAYVAPGSCDASECGSAAKPWCRPQLALDNTKGPVVVRVAAGSYEGGAELRDGVTLEGGYSADFSKRSADPLTNGTVLHAGTKPAVTGAAQGSATVDGVKVEVVPAGPQAVGIQTSGSGALVLRGVVVTAGAPGAAADDACGVLQGAATSGALTVEEGCSFEGVAATTTSAGVCLGGSGAATLKAATARGGAAAQSAGIRLYGTGALSVAQGTLAGGTGSARAAGLTAVPGSGVSALGNIELTGVAIQGGQGPETYGVEAERANELLITGGSIQGESPGAAKPGQRGVGVWVRQAAGEVHLKQLTVVGASTAETRIGVMVDDSALILELSDVAGATLAGGRRAVGVRVGGKGPDGATVVLQKNTRLAGGAPTGLGQKYDAAGVELETATKAQVLENDLVVGCVSACKADASASAAAGLRVLAGKHEAKNNKSLLGGPQSGGAALDKGSHAGVSVVGACSGTGCVAGSLDLASNDQVAGNLDATALPSKALGVEVTGATVSLVNNVRIVGGYAVASAAGVDAAGGKSSSIVGNHIDGGAADKTLGVRTQQQAMLLLRGNVIQACGLVVSGNPAPGCLTAKESTALTSLGDVNSRLSNNYAFGGHGAIATGCAVGNGGDGDGAVQLVYNLCLAQGRAKQAADPTTEAVGVRFVSVGGQPPTGLQLINNIFAVGPLAFERYAAREPSGSMLIVQYNDFFLLPTANLGPNGAYYKRADTEIDIPNDLNQPSNGGTFDHNFVKDPKFKNPNLNLPPEDGFYPDNTCQIRDTGVITSAEAKDIKDKTRGGGGATGLPEVGPYECP